MRFLAVLTFLFLIVSPSVFAQSATSSFTIGVEIAGADVTPPTTPTLLTATPITTSQIDLTWTASTDNFAVTGYNVFRDGSVIATTSLTSFSDTGLAASTSYSYQVRAFDFALNYSTTSNTIATTTPDVVVPIDPPEDENEGGVNGSVVRLVEEEILVTPGVSTSSFYVRTVRPGRFEIRWGRTNSYELGYVITEAVRREYFTVISDLEAATTYEYEIIGYTPFGNETVLRRGQFTTLQGVDIIPPENVNKFTAVADGDDVRLSWEIPVDSDIEYVRVVRNHLYFPTNPVEGAIVYQGDGDGVVDRDILLEYSPVYYTVFAYDAVGNVSSGAVAVVYKDSIQIIPVGTGQGGTETSGEGLPTEPPILIIDQEVFTDERMPELYEILITQGEVRRTFFDTGIQLDDDLPLTISIPKQAVTSNLKSIIVTLLDPTDNRKSYSFLLRINKNSTAYEAMLAPLQVIGKSRMTVEVYDFESGVLGTYQKAVEFIEVPDVNERFTTNPAFFALPSPSRLALFALSLLILVIIFWWFLLRRDKDEDKN